MADARGGADVSQRDALPASWRPGRACPPGRRVGRRPPRVRARRPSVLVTEASRSAEPVAGAREAVGHRQQHGERRAGGGGPSDPPPRRTRRARGLRVPRADAPSPDASRDARGAVALSAYPAAGASDRDGDVGHGNPASRFGQRRSEARSPRGRARPLRRRTPAAGPPGCRALRRGRRARARGVARALVPAAVGGRRGGETDRRGRRRTRCGGTLQARGAEAKGPRQQHRHAARTPGRAARPEPRQLGSTRTKRACETRKADPRGHEAERRGRPEPSGGGTNGAHGEKWTEGVAEAEEKRRV